MKFFAESDRWNAVFGGRAWESIGFRTNFGGMEDGILGHFIIYD